jgi:glycosyltransferase involved in cell wall biosynthesis
MTRPLIYLLHSGQMFGTERMALATLEALRSEFAGVIIAPPGPVHQAAHAAGLTSIASPGRLAMLSALTRQLLLSPDAVLFTTGVWQSMAGRVLQRLLRGRGAHLHMVHGGTDERLSYGRKKLLVHGRITLVAVSDFVRQRLIAHGVPAERIEVICNFLPEATPTQRPAFTQDGVRRVLMLSRLDRIKRVGLLLDALDKVPGLENLRFDLYGSGEEAETIKARAKRHPNVHLHGFVANAAQALGHADLLLHTCPEEPFGLVLLEAFSAGVPVLVPNSGGAGDIVQDGQNGWHFTANDAVALGQRLLALQQASAEQLNAMAAGGRHSLTHDYNPSVQAARYAALARRPD